MIVTGTTAKASSGLNPEPTKSEPNTKPTAEPTAEPAAFDLLNMNTKSEPTVELTASGSMNMDQHSEPAGTAQPSPQTGSVVNRTRVKKLPLYKRPVNSLEAAELEENYDTNLKQPAPPIELSATYKVGLYLHTVRRLCYERMKKNCYI